MHISSSTFESVYGFAPTAKITTGDVTNSNGDDQIALRNGTTIYDIFGVPGEDGTGTAHEFEDGELKRIYCNSSKSKLGLQVSGM